MLIEDLASALNSRDQIDLIILDFCKAFDKVPHQSSSSNLYFARVIPSIQTVLLSIGALEFKNLQYTFKNLLQPIYKMQGTFTNI